MKTLVLISLLVAALFLLGCQGQTTITSDDGNVQVEASGFDSDEWCQAGAEWKMAATSDQGDTHAQWTIKGLVSSGEFAGLCHVEYTIDSVEGLSKVDYYFSEDGETGYFEMDINGQKIKQEWSK